MKPVMLFFLLVMFSFIHAQTLRFNKGDKAPAFSAISHNGNKIDLEKVIAKGPVILMFYRGYWCPFCNRQLTQLQDSLEQVIVKGATVIAVTPETAAFVDKTVEKTHASFEVISDTTYSILKKYGVDFKVDDNTVEKYKGYGIDFTKVNGNTENVLPVPATFIIGKDGKFRYIYFDKDYRKRPSVKELLANL